MICEKIYHENIQKVCIIFLLFSSFLSSIQDGQMISFFEEALCRRSYRGVFLKKNFNL